jgi:hypothetical protein
MKPGGQFFMTQRGQFRVAFDKGLRPVFRYACQARVAGLETAHSFALA